VHARGERAQLVLGARGRQRGVADVVVEVEARVVDPHRAAGLERRERELLPVARDEVQPAADLRAEVVVVERRALEDQDRADVHVRVLAFLGEEGRVHRCEPVAVRLRHAFSSPGFPAKPIASPAVPSNGEIRELAPGEEALAAAALLELRPHLGDAAALAERAAAQRAAGYRIAAAFEPGEAEAAAAAGFRIAENLAWGRHMYVDDLSTRAGHRGRGHGAALMSWLTETARAEGCGELHLDSGVGPERESAHRLYFGARLRIASYHFTRVL
jgi:GNAT superfamily N-acetyltransferase